MLPLDRFLQALPIIPVLPLQPLDVSEPRRHLFRHLGQEALHFRGIQPPHTLTETHLLDLERGERHGRTSWERQPSIDLLQQDRDRYLSMDLSPRGPRAKESGSDAHVRGPFLDGGLVVVAHSHGQKAREAGPLGAGSELCAELTETDEPEARRLRIVSKGGSEGRNRHETHDAQPGAPAGPGRPGEAGERPDRLGEALRREAMLALLGAHVDFQEAIDAEAPRAGFTVDRLGDLRTVDRMDGAEEVQGGADLVEQE